MPVLLLLVALVALIGWGVVAGIPVERRLVPMLIRQARGRPWRAALTSAGVQLGALAGFGAASLVAVLIGRLAGRPLLLVLESVAMLAYVPVLMAALPTQFSGYGPARREMQQKGASRGVARAIAWSGGTVAIVGLFGVFAAFSTLFDPD